MRKILIICLSFIVLFFLAGCSINPVTGQSALNFYSEQDEVKIGEDEHPKIVAQYGEYADEKIRSYVQEIVTKIGDFSHRPNLNYQVSVLDTPMVNAFALPGGHVYVCRGLLPYLNSEAELAAVMAHEIGHVTARHSVEQLSKSQGLQLGLLLGLLFFKEEKTSQQFYDVGSQLSVLASLSFSRENEMEADRLAVAYTNKAGYSPLGTEKVMKMFEWMSEGKTNSLLSILSTHPMSDLRAKQARIEVRELKDKGKIKEEVDRERYLDMINGLLLGYDPARGVVFGRTYYNSTYKFKINLPNAYKYYLEVPEYLFALESEDKANQIYFQMLSPDQADEQARSAALTAKLKTKPVRTATLFWQNTPGLANLYILSDTNGQPVIQVTHYLVRYFQKILEVTCFEQVNNPGTDIDYITQVMNRIELLTEQEMPKLLEKVRHLKLYEPATGETWASIADRNFPGADPVRLSHLNGCELTEPLPKRIKLLLF